MMTQYTPLPAPKSVLRAGLGLAALGLISTAAAQTSPSTAPPVPNLIGQERNFAVLNNGNFDETLYTVPAPNADAAQFRFKLKGYVFGFRMIKANYSGYYTDQSYAAYADIKTSGLGALLKKMEIWAVTRGKWAIQSGLKPDFHVQQNMDKKNRRVEMNYDNTARAIDVHIVPRLGSQGVPPASPEERYAANDTLSAILAMMMQGAQTEGRVCEGRVPVFDSKQHYNLRMEKVEILTYSYKKRDLPAIKCHVYYEPVSGFDPEDLPDSEEESTPIQVYFTKMDNLGLYVPLKFTYKISSIKATIKVDDMVIIPPNK